MEDPNTTYYRLVALQEKLKPDEGPTLLLCSGGMRHNNLILIIYIHTLPI